MTAQRGSPKYVDPYLFGKSKDYKYEWDMYSLGLILLELISGNFLFKISRSEEYDIDQFFDHMKYSI